MIQNRGKKICMIYYNNTEYTKAVLNNTIIYNNKFSINITGETVLNTGMCYEYYMNINGNIVKPTSILIESNNSNNVEIYDNNIHFLISGKYNVIFNYKSYKQNINIQIQDITLQIS